MNNRIFKNFFNRISLIFGGIFSKSELDDLVPSDVLLSSRDADKSFRYNGLAYGHFIDSLSAILQNQGLSVISVAMPISKLHQAKTWGRSVAVNREYVLAKICEKVIPFSNRHSELHVWLIVLEKVHPKCIVAVQPTPALCAAGKQRGIPVFDLQHGVIEPGVYYNQNLLAMYGNSGLPSAVLCWDLPSKLALEQALPDVKGVIVGNLWVTRFNCPNLHDDIVTHELERVISVLTSELPIALITLQWDQSVPKELLIPLEVVEGFKQMVERNWVLWVRFHPVQLQTVGRDELRDKWFSLTGLEFGLGKVFDTSEFAMPALLSLARIHITAFSASAIEAYLMGVPSILWRDDENVRAWFKDYMTGGLVSILTGSADDLVDWAENNIQRKREGRGYPNSTIYDEKSLLKTLINED